MRKLRLAPSILTADFAKLGEEIASVAGFVDWFHLDVMDGHYVPNLTFGPDVVAALRRVTDVPFHVHLMIEDPLSYVQRFAEAGANRLSFHPEVVEDVAKVMEGIRSVGAGVGVAVHPDVPLGDVKETLREADVILMMTVRPGFGGQSFLTEVLPKVEAARALVEAEALGADIEVDGGVNLETVVSAVEAGADILVAGSAIFDGVDAVAAARRLRSRLDDLGKEYV